MSAKLAVAEIDARDHVAEDIRALGDWFHNIEIGGVQTAPQHFLGDYPKVKWERFQHAIPNDLLGKTVLDVGCNAGFYSIEMKRRGAERVVGIDFDERYLAQAKFAANALGCEIGLQTLSEAIWLHRQRPARRRIGFQRTRARSQGPAHLVSAWRPARRPARFIVG